MCPGFAIAGAIVTYYFTPEMPRDLATEDAAFKAYLEANGWDTSSWGGEDSARKEVEAPKEVEVVKAGTSERSIDEDEKVV